MVERGLEPWEKILWSDEYLQIIYREWANNFMRKQKRSAAIHYFKKSLELKDDDPKALYFLSLCEKDFAMVGASYNSILRAFQVAEKNQPVNLQICDALYDLNDFEHSGVELKSKSRLFTGYKIKPFEHKFDVVEGNISDSLGDALHDFIQEYKKYFQIIKAMRIKEENPDERPQWKIQRDNQECDVVSIIEEIEPLVHPRERARLARGYKIFNSRYLKNSAIDVEFLKFLKTNKTLLLPQSNITPVLKKVAENNYEIIIKFERMLQARSPLYHEKLMRCPSKPRCRKETEDNLNRIQYSTRRMMFLILNHIKEFRKTRNMDDLSKYVELVMGDLIILKTHRLIPWKFEFINEVYNTLGLAYMDFVVIPSSLDLVETGKERLHVMLGLPLPDERLTVNQFVFGDKSTWLEPEATDYPYIRYNKLIKRLEKRIFFADYPIEKCYLSFEMSRNHLNQNKFDECINCSKKYYKETDECQNIMWKFLLELIALKAKVAQWKIEKARESTVDMKKIAEQLGIETIIDFVKLADSLLVSEIKKKASNQQQIHSFGSKKSRGQSIQMQSITSM